MDAFTEEQSALLSLPGTSFPTDEVLDTAVRKTPYVRFDSNDYSIPHDRTHRTITVVADPTTVRLRDKTETIAVHDRTYDRGQQIENPAHIAALVRAKSHARKHRAIDRLRHEVPRSQELLVQLAERGRNLGSATAALMRLLDRYGASELDIAISEAIDRGTVDPHSVRQVLERRCRQRGAPPPTSMLLDEELRNLSVKPHSLESYDSPQETKDTAENDHEEEE